MDLLGKRYLRRSHRPTQISLTQNSFRHAVLFDRCRKTTVGQEDLRCNRSQVMGEGVDLQRYCRHVIHHDLAWNPSSIEQRTGRIDRLGCKAEGRHPIHVYLPYLNGTADERQYRVMKDREQWFRIVMGQDEVAKLIPHDDAQPYPLPTAFAADLTFDLALPQVPG